MLLVESQVRVRVRLGLAMLPVGGQGRFGLLSWVKLD